MHHLVLFLLAAGGAAAQTPPAFERGVVIPSVACAAKPEQSYALYLPSNYTPQRKWPVIFAFDPAARGHVPLDLLKDAAEKYGYIVAGSNNSRNGPARPQMEAVEAIIQDVTTRLAVDPRRMYTTGFSGGARVAVMAAQICGDCIAGVFGQGAGFPSSAQPWKDVRFSYFGAVGELDFNHAEVLDLVEQLENSGAAVRLRVFTGTHNYAPPDVQMEAVEWLELRAMVEDRRAKDNAFIAEQFARARARAEQVESTGDRYAAWREYAAVARDFAGLPEATPFAARTAEWKDSAALDEARKRVHREIDRQRALTAPFGMNLEALRQDSSRRTELLPQLYATVSELRHGSTSRKEDQRRVYSRALTQVFAHAIESGNAELREKNLSFAIVCYELAREARPESPGPPYGLARAHAANGRKKPALEALREAIGKGLRDAALLRTTPEFSPLQSDPEFQKLVELLGQSPSARP